MRQVDTLILRFRDLGNDDTIAEHKTKKIIIEKRKMDRYEENDSIICVHEIRV